MPRPRRFEVTHTPEEWRKLLTPEQYAVLREEDTERPFTSPLNNEKRKGHLHLRRLRPAAVLLRDQVRLRHRLAELLCPDRRRGEGQAGLDLRHGQGRGALPPLRRPSRPCVQRRPEAHRAPLLHERRVAEIRRGLRLRFWADVLAGSCFDHVGHIRLAAEQVQVSRRDRNNGVAKRSPQQPVGQYPDGRQRFVDDAVTLTQTDTENRDRAFAAGQPDICLPGWSWPKS